MYTGTSEFSGLAAILDRLYGGKHRSKLAGILQKDTHRACVTHAAKMAGENQTFGAETGQQRIDMPDVPFDEAPDQWYAYAAQCFGEEVSVVGYMYT